MTSTTSTARRERGDRAALARPPGEDTATAARPATRTDFDADADHARARREALPGVRTCVACQSERDARAVSTGINRRGSKDSQLR